MLGAYARLRELPFRWQWTLPGEREDLPWKVGRDERVVAEVVTGSDDEVANQLVWRSRAPWLLFLDRYSVPDPDGILRAYEALDDEAFDEDAPTGEPSAMAYRGAERGRLEPWSGSDLSQWLRQASGHWGPGQVLWRRAWVVRAGGLPAMPHSHWLLAALATTTAATTTVPDALSAHPPPEALHLGWIDSQRRARRTRGLIVP